MVIETKSRRLRLIAHLCRALPPILSGRVQTWFYPRRIAQQENAGFTARASLADVVFRYPRAEVHATALAVRGFYEWRNVVLANALCNAGDTIVDVGANIGTETLIFSRLVGDEGLVVAFEPMRENFALLQEFRESNGLVNLKLHQAAVSDAEGTLWFQPSESEWTTGVGRVVAQRRAEVGAYEVPSVVLDKLYEAGELRHPRLLVMDVEGTEPMVLRGAARILARERPYLILEVQPQLLAYHGRTPRDLYEDLARRVYKPWRISSWGLDPASPDQSDGANWLCIPAANARRAASLARRLTLRMLESAFLPLVRRLNPAVVTRSAQRGSRLA